MTRRRPRYVHRLTTQISGRINRPDFQAFLDQAGVVKCRAPSRLWADTETSQLVHLFLVQALCTPHLLRVDNSELQLTADFEQLLVCAAQRSGVQRSFRNIVDKVKRLAKELIDLMRRQRQV